MERTAERTAKKQGEMDAFHGRKEETPDASNAEGSSVSEDGAGGGTRTHTVSPPADFESATSTIPSHRQVQELLYAIAVPFASKILRSNGESKVYAVFMIAGKSDRANCPGHFWQKW